MTSSSVLLAVEWAIDNIIFYTVRDKGLSLSVRDHEMW